MGNMADGAEQVSLGRLERNRGFLFCSEKCTGSETQFYNQGRRLLWQSEGIKEKKRLPSKKVPDKKIKIRRPQENEALLAKD